MGAKWFRLKLNIDKIQVVGCYYKKTKIRNDNILTKITDKVKSLFAFNCVAFN